MKNKLLIFIITLFFISCERDKELIIENTDIQLISNAFVSSLAISVEWQDLVNDEVVANTII